MNSGREATHIPIGIVMLLLSLMAVACAGEGPATGEGPPTGGVTPTAPPVEYGASLSEWEAAVRSDSGQSESANTNAPGQETAGADTLPSPIVITGETSSEVVVEARPADGSSEEPLSQETAGAAVSPTGEVTADDAVQPGESEAAPATVVDSQTEAAPQSTEAGDGYREMVWEDLIPADYTAEAIMAKYQDELAKFQDGDPAAMELYTEMQNEFNNAPVNEALNNTMMKLPGFIAPLEYTEDLITEFLLVPYFGACIHVPAPPANQTVLVELADGNGITIEEAYEPVWVLGMLTTAGTTTELASAGYSVQNAHIEPYSYSP